MIQYLTPLLIIAVVWLIYYCIIEPKKRFQSYQRQLQDKGYSVYKLPFKPFAIPILHLFHKSNDEGDVMGFVKKDMRDHDVLLTNYFHKIMLDFTHPDLIKEFYSPDKTYIYPKVNAMFAPIKRVMGEGVPFSEGDVWKRKRRITNKVFNFQLIKQMTNKIAELCDWAIEDVQKNSKSPEPGFIEYNILNLMTRMFSNVILECFLGGGSTQRLDDEQISQFMSQLINDATKNSYDPIPMILGVLGFNFTAAGIRQKDKSVNRRVKIFREWGHKYVHQKVIEIKESLKNTDLKNKNPSNIIEALVIDQLLGEQNLSAEKEKEKQKYYSEEEIFEEFCTFFVAGTDTSSNYLLMSIYMIAKNPQIERKLREEIAQHMKTEDYSYENLKKFVYIDSIQKETSRYYGPATGLFIRQANKDNLLNGIAIKKGTYMVVQHLGNHYSEKYFKDPFEFRPQRWENQCDDLPNFVTGGFSAGARACIGKQLALIEAKIGLIKFMKRYKKIILPNPDFKMVMKFVYAPQDFETKMQINPQID